jgi:hypothetical protein
MPRSRAGRLVAIADQRADAIALRGQPPREMPARETGRAGDQRVHRSATTVTGEPNARSRPIDASAPSTPRVTPSLPIFLCSAIGRTNCV